MTDALFGRLRRHQLVRFIVVGAFNTALCYGVYALLLVAGLPFWAANLGAVAFGVCWSYFALGRLVFGNKDSSRLGHFILGWAAVYGVQTGLIALIMRTGIGPTLAGLIVLPGATAASFLIQKLLVFRRPAPTV